MRPQRFYYVSGRGWMTVEPSRCRECGSRNGSRMVERPVTDTEFFGIIAPAQQEDGSVKEITIKIGWMPKP